MAKETVTFLARNRIGNKNEDFGSFTASGTAGYFKTKLSWVDHAEFQSPNEATPETEIITMLNSSDGTEGTLAGAVYFSGGATDKYFFRAVGSG